jgi:hypothetical protein
VVPLGSLLGEPGHEAMTEWRDADLVYSFGRAPAGAVTLRNFPRDLRRMLGSTAAHTPHFDLDLAATDILRCRELGVPRYNDLRRALHMKPLRSIDEITPCADWQDRIRYVYGDDVERIDLLVGLCADARPEEFAFSDTAFRVFLLMAPRRMLSDRFYTADYREDVYTRAGINWVESNSMATVIRRHFRELESRLARDANAFAPWTA